MKKKLAEEIKEKAKRIAEDDDKMGQLIRSVIDKVDELGENASLKKLINKVEKLIKMVKSYYHGEYTQYPKRTLLLILFGLIYFLMPIDAIPDFIPIYGFIDDLTVLLWVYRSIRKDIDAYDEWEKQKLSTD